MYRERERGGESLREREGGWESKRERERERERESRERGSYTWNVKIIWTSDTKLIKEYSLFSLFLQKMDNK